MVGRGSRSTPAKARFVRRIILLLGRACLDDAIVRNRSCGERQGDDGAQHVVYFVARAEQYAARSHVRRAFWATWHVLGAAGGATDELSWLEVVVGRAKGGFVGLGVGLGVVVEVMAVG